MDVSNYVVLLSVRDEDHLLDYADLFYDTPFTLFVEPDLGNEHTALAVLPNGSARKLASLPLALREEVTT